MTANPGGGDYVGPGRKFLHGDYVPDIPHAPAAPKTAPIGRVLLRFRGRFPEEMAVRGRADEMEHFLTRAIDHFKMNGSVEWDTLEFRIETPGVDEGSGLARVWQWQVWAER